MKSPFEHLGAKPTKEKIDQAKEQFADFAESKEGVRLLKAHEDVRRKFGDGIARMVSADLAITGLCDLILTLYRSRFNIDNPNELINDNSYKHSMEQDLKEMIGGLLPGRLEETVSKYRRVDEQGND